MNELSTAELQRVQRDAVLCLPVSRPANTRAMPLKSSRFANQDSAARRLKPNRPVGHAVLTFCPLSRKLKKQKSLRPLRLCGEAAFHWRKNP